MYLRPLTIRLDRAATFCLTHCERGLYALHRNALKPKMGASRLEVGRFRTRPRCFFLTPCTLGRSPLPSRSPTCIQATDLPDSFYDWTTRYPTQRGGEGRRGCLHLNIVENRRRTRQDTINTLYPRAFTRSLGDYVALLSIPNFTWTRAGAPTFSAE